MVLFEFLTATVAMTLGAITIWILIIRKEKRHVRVSESKDYNMGELSSMAESLNQRIDVLESILDAEVPDWREQNEQRSE
ncbi:MAG: hypothetical protein AB8B95_12130 [Pseudohongiellaceae bacterium]